jgi:hypothetical protein
MQKKLNLGVIPVSPVLVRTPHCIGRVSGGTYIKFSSQPIKLLCNNCGCCRILLSLTSVLTSEFIPERADVVV